MPRRTDAKGRSKTDRFFQLSSRVYDSAAYRALAPAEKAMLSEMMMLYNGANNGALWLSIRDAAALVGFMDEEAASNALKALVAHGLLAIVTPGYFAMKQRHATSYRLTFLPANGMPPTDDWRNWKATTGSKQAKRLIRISKCNLRSCFSGLAAWISRADTAKAIAVNFTPGRIFRAVDAENAAIAECESDRESGAHILCHTGGSSRASAETCIDLATRAREWIEREGYGAQGRLAGRAGLTQSKLSRFVNCDTGRRRLGLAEAERLESVLSANKRNNPS